MFTVICCSNDEAILTHVLQPGLEAQVPHQFLLWRNTPQGNEPLPVVYNRLRREAEGDWLLFAHQDVRLLPRALLHLEEKLKRLEDRQGPIGVFGLAGASSDGWLHNGSCYPSTYGASHVGVQTLDECLFGCRPEVLEELGGFAEVDALAWHGYATWLCTRVANAGLPNFVVQVLAQHEGPHHASNLHLSSLREAQRWVAQRARVPVATSGGTLKLVPAGDMQVALAKGLAEGPGAGHADRPQTPWHARTDCRSDVTGAAVCAERGDGP